jgi:hypothetical protein
MAIPSLWASCYSTKAAALQQVLKQEEVEGQHGPQNSTLMPIGVSFKILGNANPNSQPPSWWPWVCSVVRAWILADESGVRGKYPPPYKRDPLAMGVNPDRISKPLM